MAQTSDARLGGKLNQPGAASRIWAGADLPTGHVILHQRLLGRALVASPGRRQFAAAPASPARTRALSWRASRPQSGVWAIGVWAGMKTQWRPWPGGQMNAKHPAGQGGAAPLDERHDPSAINPSHPANYRPAALQTMPIYRKMSYAWGAVCGAAATAQSLGQGPSIFSE